MLVRGPTSADGVLSAHVLARLAAVGQSRMAATEVQTVSADSVARTITTAQEALTALTTARSTPAAAVPSGAHVVVDSPAEAHSEAVAAEVSLAEVAVVTLADADKRYSEDTLFI